MENKQGAETENYNEIIGIAPDDTQSLEMFADLCRTCASTNDHMIPILEGEGLQYNLQSKINKYLPINVTDTDNLPLQLCYHCAATILSYHEITESCLQIQQKLQQIREKLDSRQEQTNTVVYVEDIQEIKNKIGEIDTNRVKLNCDKETSTVEDHTNTNIDMEKEDALNEKRSAVIQPSNAITSMENKSRCEMSADNKSRDVSLDHVHQRDVEQQIHGDMINDTDLEESLKCEVSNSTQLDQETNKKQKKSTNRRRVNRRTRYESYPCMNCDFIAKQKKLLSQHMADHHPDLPFDQSIKRKHVHRDLIEKARVESDGRVYYKCKDCEKILFSPYTFYCHTRIHTGEKPYTCHMCGKQFRVKQGLVRHLNETHAGIKNYPCEICLRTFATKRTLDDHVRTHTGERPFVCITCGKSFKQKASLFVHSRTHTDVFPFKCVHCDQVFRTRPLLMLHITKHTGEKPYVCDICERPFRIKHELKRHKLIHSDDKPWQCPECGLSFRQKRYLVNHHKTNHTKDVTLEVCEFKE